jgi:hypothetical protein
MTLIYNHNALVTLSNTFSDPCKPFQKTFPGQCTRRHDIPRSVINLVQLQHICTIHWIRSSRHVHLIGEYKYRYATVPNLGTFHQHSEFLLSNAETRRVYGIYYIDDSINLFDIGFP